MSLPSSHLYFHLTHSEHHFMSFVENGYVEVNDDEPFVLLHGAAFHVHSSIRICAMWPVVTRTVVEL